jgi:hypothetical protein
LQADRRLLPSAGLTIVEMYVRSWHIPDLGGWVAESVLGDEADIEVGDGRFRRLRIAAAKLSLP